jgi:hypothetical protein
MDMDLHADQYKAIEQGQSAVTTLFSCMMLHGHTYGPLRHLLRPEWSFAACCFANMDDVAKYHYSDYNVWVRSPFGNPDTTPGQFGTLDTVPDYTFYHKIRLGTKACLEILISGCDGWMTNREHSLEVGGLIVGHTLLPLNIAGIIQVVKWLDADERYSPNLSSEIWISMEGCAPYRDIAYESCAHQDRLKNWYKGNPNSIGWIFSTLSAWFTMFRHGQAETARPQRLVLWMNAQDLNKRDTECPPDEDFDTWNEESERDRCCMGS